MSAVLNQSTSDIDARIKRIYDHLYANAAVRTPAGIATEVGKLIRTAAFMERGAGIFPAFSLSTDLRRALLKGEQDATKLFASDLRSRFAEMTTEWKLYNGDGLLLSDNDIAWCCAQLDQVIVTAGKRDVFGDAVEIFRTNWAKQSSGQFFTDGRVTHLAMTLLEFDPFAGDDLIDVCCGTGGFLLAGLDRIRSLADIRLPMKDREQAISEIGLKALRGQEVDPEICEIANASLASRLGRPDVNLVQRGDSLLPSMFQDRTVGALREGTHLCAASNPPFGTKITVKNPETLCYYDLASPTTGRTTPRAPDILLLERNIRMLKPGEGRLAIVIPYQILSGPQTRYIRDWILRQTHLEAVVDLPPETFQPHTGTKTSLLVLRRRKKPLMAAVTCGTEEVFMSTPRWIGHDRRGQPVYRRGPEGRHTPTILSDIEAVGHAFEAFRNSQPPSSMHAESFVVPLGRIAADTELRLNARYYRNSPNVLDTANAHKNWTTIRLGDACERIFFPTRFKREYVEPSDAAVPFLGGANITELLAETDKWISKEDPRFSELVVRAGWILVTRSGTTGIVSSVPSAWDGVAISEHVIRIVARPEVLSPAWIQVYLRSKTGQRAIARGIFGSVIDEITPDFLAGLEVPVPTSRKVYERIVAEIEQAEAARQTSVERFRRAITEIEDLMR